MNEFKLKFEHVCIIALIVLIFIFNQNTNTRINALYGLHNNTDQIARQNFDLILTHRYEVNNATEAFRLHLEDTVYGE